MIGVLPLFLAYALFGIVVFGPSNYRFSSWQRTFVEMFAVRFPLLLAARFLTAPLLLRASLIITFCER